MGMVKVLKLIECVLLVAVLLSCLVFTVISLITHPIPFIISTIFFYYLFYKIDRSYR